jgi:hypothetical protein
MEDERTSLQERALTRVLHINAKVHGVVTGILLGTAIFIATNWLILKGGEPVGPHLALLGQFFWGYSVSFVGSFVGLGYGFVCGFVIGYLMAWTYNHVLTFRTSTTA